MWNSVSLRVRVCGTRLVVFFFSLVFARIDASQSKLCSLHTQVYEICNDWFGPVQIMYLFIYLFKRDSVHERTCQTRKRARFSSRNYFSSVIIPIIQLFAGCSCSPVLNRADQTNCLLPSGSVNTDVCIRMEHPFIILHQSSCSVFSRGCRCGVYKVLHRTRKERK